MSYAAQPPVPASPPGPAPPAGPSRPAAVTTAVALLWTMGVAGLAYAVSMVAIAPATISRFRDAAPGADQAEAFVAVIWLDAAVAAVLAILVVALFVVLGLGLRRGSRLARGVTFAVCVLGIVGGIGSLATIGVQRSGDALAGSVGEALGGAYPNGWLGLNIAVAGAQILAYLLVGGLLLMAPRRFFGIEAAAQPAVAPFGGFPPHHPSGAGWPAVQPHGATWPAAQPPGAAGAAWPAAQPPAAGWPTAQPPAAGWPAGQPSPPGFTPPPDYGAGAYPPPGYSAPAGWGPPPTHSPYAPPLTPVAPANDLSTFPAQQEASAVPTTSESGSSASPNLNESSVTTPISNSPEWTATHSQQKPSEPDQASSLAPADKPPAGPEDEYWSRPSDSEPRNDR